MDLRGRFLVLFFLFSAFFLSAADHPAELVYAEGEGFTLVREGESRFYDLWEESAEGLGLVEGDVILTEAGTWLEIRLADSLIKVAENTTFSLSSLENRGGSFELAYGRVRARVEKLSDDSPFWIGGSDTVAGVRGTDFGYDLFYDPASPEKKSVSVYCFEGKVEVVRHLKPAEGEEFEADRDFKKGKDLTSTVILRRNEMVQVDTSLEQEPLRRQRLDPGIKDFWEENTFLYDPEEASAAAGGADDAEAGEDAGDAAEQSGFQIFHNDVKRLRQGAAIAGISGSLVAGAGVAAMLLSDDGVGTGAGLMTVGGSLIAAGGYFFIRSLVLQNRAP